MSHWAELDQNNVVIRVLVGDNNDPNGDEGYQLLIDNLGGTWVKTSYNAFAGKRIDPETNEITDDPGFRKNYAGIGYSYDSSRDAFIPPKPYDSWTLDENSCTWVPPINKPSSPNATYVWNENSLSWDEYDRSTEID
jgi:hypothetical protein